MATKQKEVVFDDTPEYVESASGETAAPVEEEPANKEKAKRVIHVFGRPHEVIKTVRDRLTGHIYDHYETVTRIRNKQSGDVNEVRLVHRLRRQVDPTAPKPARFEEVVEE